VASGAAFTAVLLICCRYLAEAMAHYPLVFGPLIVGALAAFSVSFYATFFTRPAETPDPLYRYQRGADGADALHLPS
jgi:hypothetical protein